MEERVEGLRIVELQVANVMGIKAARVKPSGSAVTVGGANGSGKTSLLNAIEAAFQGKDTKRFPALLRDGESSGQIVVTTQDLVVKRTLTAAGGGSLTITRADGSRQQETPQALLDSLFASVAFDPSEFIRMSPKEQSKVMAELAGIDLDEFEAKRKAVYDARRDANRTVQKLQAALDKMPNPSNAPDEELSAADVASELAAAKGMADKVKLVAAQAELAVKSYRARKDELRKAQADLAEAVERLDRAKIKEAEELEVANAKVSDHEKVLALHSGIDAKISEISERLSGIEATNALVREAREYRRVQKELDEVSATAAKLDKALEYLDQERDSTMASADLGVDGLGFDEDNNVVFNGRPLSTLSSSEKLRVSLAINAALNTTLRVVLMRDAAYLDDKSMEEVRRFAEERDLQVWLEVPSTDGRAEIVIQDGEVVSIPS